MKMTKPQKRKMYHEMTVEEICESMSPQELQVNARKGGVAAIAEVKRRKDGYVHIPPTPELDIGV